MSSDTELTAPDGSVWSLDNLAVEYCMQGEASGLDVAAVYLLKRSGELFQEGNDEWAKLHRQLAATFRAMGESKRAETKKRRAEYPSMIRQAPPEGKARR